MRVLVFVGTALAVLAGFARDAAPVAVEGKNVYDVRYGSLPGDWENLVRTEPGSWDFNFRPYGRTEDLVSDPSLVRDVSQGGLGDGKVRPTGLRVSCDADGFAVLVFCGEPDITGALAATNSLPLPSLEIFLLPDNTDNVKPADYWQLVVGNGTVRQFDFLPEGRHWRLLLPYVRHDTRRLKNGYVFRFDIPWAAVWDKLPFGDRADNFWRLQVIRWSDGGRTWGGEVHEPARAGYIRWPSFADGRGTEIRRRLLERAWTEFRVLSATPAYDVTVKAFAYGRSPFVRTEPYAVAQTAADGPRTYVNYSENPAFRPVLERLTDERLGLGPQIAGFDGLSEEAQASLYGRASAALFNFRYAVEAAYAKHLKGVFLK